MRAKTTAIGAFLAGIEAGSIPGDVFSEDAVLDATVPNWRFSVHGSAAVLAELARWYADPGHFEHLSRTPLPDGELVEFSLSWEEDGIPHACHQAHILQLRDSKVSADTAFCGGRWPERLLTEMSQASRENRSV